MDLHAACSEQVRDIIVTEESFSDFEASSTSERSEDVADADNGITDNSMVAAEHSRRDLTQRHHLAWADLSVINVDAGAKE